MFYSLYTRSAGRPKAENKSPTVVIVRIKPKTSPLCHASSVRCSQRNEICPGVKLVACTRNPFVVRELIRDGRFARELGHGIQALVPADEWKVSDHEFRVLYGNGYWYALYSIARKEHWTEKI
jgi:hypothetical protein